MQEKWSHSSVDCCTGKIHSVANETMLSSATNQIKSPCISSCIKI